MKTLERFIWQYHTLQQACKHAPTHPITVLDAENGFFDLYRRATPEQRLEFWQRTLLFQDLEDGRIPADFRIEVMLEADNPYEALPMVHEHRHQDVDHYIQPRISVKSERYFD